MEQKSPLIPLCRIYQNESQRTGKPYLVGNLTYTTKLIGFESEDESGNVCWQLYVQERPPKGSASQNAEQHPSPQEQPRRHAELTAGTLADARATRIMGWRIQPGNTWSA